MIFQIIIIIIFLLIPIISILKRINIYRPKLSKKDKKGYIKIYDKRNIINSLMLYPPNNNNNNNKIILFSYGRWGNIDKTIYVIKPYLDLNIPIITYDYLGYGGSNGNVCEENCYKSILIVYNYLINKLKYKPNNIILFGFSLGSSISSWLASYLINKNIKIGCLIIHSGFNNMQLLNNKYGYLNMFLTDFNSNRYINNLSKKSNIPIIIIHSKKDTFINEEHAKNNYNIIENDNKYLIWLKEGNHSSPIYKKKISKMILNVLKINNY